MKNPATSKVIEAAGTKNAAAATSSTAQNQKVFAAAAEAGVKVPTSPKPAPGQKR